MRRFVTGFAIVMLTVLVPSAGRAATQTRAIDVVNNAFQPSASVANAGDSVTWHFKGGNVDPQNTDRAVAHTVTAYSGATFDSGPMQSNQTFTFTLPNDPQNPQPVLVYYRCRIHSTLDSNNKCSGMCGMLTSTPPPLPAPTIQNPKDGSTSSTNDVPLLIAVNGDKMTGVQLQDQSGSGPPVTIASFNLKNGDSYDTFVSTTLTLPNGPHSLTAFSEQADGFYTPLSSAVAFTVAGADTLAPRVALSAPVPQNSGLPTIASNPVFINGSATDDVAVKQISVDITNAVTGLPTAGNDINCDPCGGKTAPFSGNVVLPPGRYTITVRAYDAVALSTLDDQTKAAHTGSVSRDVLVVM